MIPKHAAEWLCKWQTLQDMRYLTLKQRAKIVKRLYGLAKCTHAAVLKVYQENGITYKMPGKTNRLSEERER